MRICKECGRELDDSTELCPYCGYEEKLIICPECGQAIEATAMYCQSCGYPINNMPEQETVPIQEKKAKVHHKQVLGVILCIIAVLSILFGISKANSPLRQFYLEHLEECKVAYEETLTLSAQSSGFIKNTYLDLADSYQNLIDYDLEQINKFRMQTIAFCVSGAVLIFTGVKLIRRSE